MANPWVTGIIVASVVGIGGYTWFISRDTTPIGLVIVKSQGEETLGQDTDGAKYTVQFVEGTFREDEDSLGVASIDDEQPLLVVFKDGEPIDARLITKSEWVEPTEVCDEGDTECQDKIMDAYNAMMDKVIELGEEFDVDMEWLKGQKVSKSQEAAAESIFGPMLSLQSHFMW